MSENPSEPEEREPDPAADPEEYLADEHEQVSESTGTLYEGDGEPAETPHDVADEEDEEE